MFQINQTVLNHLNHSTTQKSADKAAQSFFYAQTHLTLLHLYSLLRRERKRERERRDEGERKWERDSEREREREGGGREKDKTEKERERGSEREREGGGGERKTRQRKREREERDREWELGKYGRSKCKRVNKPFNLLKTENMESYFEVSNSGTWKICK